MTTVVKIGSSLLIEDGALRTVWLASLAEDLRDLDRPIIVSSGAIALGRARLELAEPLSLAQKQACAAAGQAELTRAYERALSPRPTAQVLLTLYDTENRRRWLNARSTVNTLLELGAVPVINENDTVTTKEIRYGDNDRLAARTAQMIGADRLILLSDIDGLYTAPPDVEGARHIPEVAEITPDILAMGAGAGSSVGTGGMATKLLAGQIASLAGCEMIIMDGRADHPLQRLHDGERHTRFLPSTQPDNARRQWIAGGLVSEGVLHVDAGAAHAIVADRSLLCVGVTEITGDFKKGDAVQVVHDGQVLARGLVAYGSRDARRIVGVNGADIEARIGYDNGPALIHRDNLVRPPNW